MQLEAGPLAGKSGDRAALDAHGIGQARSAEGGLKKNRRAGALLLSKPFAPAPDYAGLAARCALD
jgi:hypothetical protein